MEICYIEAGVLERMLARTENLSCLLYTSDAADD